MAAIDTVLTAATNPGATITATTAASGDSLSVRNFPSSGQGMLAHIVRDGATGGLARVRSPRLHDNVTGINFHSSETPTTLLLPRNTWQNLYSTDTLIVEETGGSAEVDIVALGIYYTSLPGSDARLNAWGDISGIIKNIKPVQVAVTNGGTAGTWTDTVITTTENQLHADEDYALLGYTSDTSLALVGLKGQETGNLRACGPGVSVSYDTSEWFVQLAQDTGMPMIPVFNSNNRNSVYVSTADKAASTAANVTLILAELSQSAPH